MGSKRNTSCVQDMSGNVSGKTLGEGRFRLDIGRKFFTMRVVRPWPRLPREAVAAPSLAVCKARLDGALSTLGWWEMSLPMAGGWNRMIFMVPSNLSHSMILRFCDLEGGQLFISSQVLPKSAPAQKNFPVSVRILRSQMNAVTKLTDLRQVSTSGMFLYFSNNDEFSNCVYVYLWASLCMCVYICIMYTNI